MINIDLIDFIHSHAGICSVVVDVELNTHNQSYLLKFD